MSLTAVEAEALLYDYVTENPIDWSDYVVQTQERRSLRLPASWHGVEFLSVMPPCIGKVDIDHLDNLDTISLNELSHDENGQPSGLHLYAPGQRNKNGIARNVCIWDSPEAARERIGASQTHRRAAAFGIKLYSFWTANKYNLHIGQDGQLAEVDVLYRHSFRGAPHPADLAGK